MDKKYLILLKGEYVKDKGVPYYLVSDAEKLKEGLGAYAKVSKSLYSQDFVLVKVINIFTDLEFREKR